MEQLDLLGALHLRVQGAKGRVACVRDRCRRCHHCRGGQLAHAVGLLQDAVVELGGGAGVKGQALRLRDGVRQVGRALMAVVGVVWVGVGVVWVVVMVGWGVDGAGHRWGWWRWRRGAWIRGQGGSGGSGDLVDVLAQHHHLLAGDLALWGVLA